MIVVEMALGTGQSPPRTRVVAEVIVTVFKVALEGTHQGAAGPPSEDEEEESFSSGAPNSSIRARVSSFNLASLVFLSTRPTASALALPERRNFSYAEALPVPPSDFGK